MLLATAGGWLWLRASEIGELLRTDAWPSLLALSGIYLGSHLLRMARLALLTLDERDRAFPVMAAHALTAFPSSFLPYKLGEVLRLAAFSHVYRGRRRAFAVWLVERFGDILVISAFILALYVFNVRVPAAMRTVFLLFVGASALGLLSLFAVSKVFVYLNRRLVLTSHSRRGLALLRASHALRRLEMDVHRSVDGRFTGVLLLSFLVWAVELLTLTLFLRSHAAQGAESLAILFVSGLLASIPGGVAPGIEGFGLYQSIALVALALAALAVVWTVFRAEGRVR